MLDVIMDILRSIGSLFVGILRRFRYWLPPLILDRLDAIAFYNQYLKPYLPATVHGVIAVPLENLLILTVVLVCWAGFLTYHELRVNLVAARNELDKETRKRETCQTLRDFLENLDGIHREVLRDDDESHVSEWRQKIKTWVGEVAPYVKANVSLAAEAQLRVNVLLPWIEGVKGDQLLSRQKTRMLQLIDARRTALLKTLENYCGKI